MTFRAVVHDRIRARLAAASSSSLARSPTTHADATDDEATIGDDVPIGDEVIDRCAAYLDLLARWNRKINLTALALDPLSDEAIDRLIVEPLRAAGWMAPPVRIAVDIGSGSGSPALPLNAVRPDVTFTLVESRARKAAFLREAVREIGLPSTRVATSRFEDFWPTAADRGQVDLVTVRAVRTDDELTRGIRELMAPRGVLLHFTNGQDDVPKGWRVRAPAGRLPFRALGVSGGSQV